MAKDREKQRRYQEKTDLQEVMASASGRRFMARLLFDTCRLNGICGNNDLLQRHEGRRAVGIELAMRLEEVCPELYVELITERMNTNNADRAAQAADPQTGEDDV